MKRLSVVVLFALSVLVLTGCPDQGVVCRAGTSRCGNGCADFQTDSKNCGACGQACLGSQICSGGSCLCRSGTQLCDGQCVVIESDPRHCGGCNLSCSSSDGGGNVCENKTCKTVCSLGASQCGGSCLQLNTDPLNCGACGNVCADSQSCHAGRCAWDLVAACFSTGQVVGVQAGTDLRGPLQALGSGPISLQTYGSLVLAGDSIDNRLLQVRMPGLEQLSEFNALGRGVNQILVDAPRVYSINSIGHTVQVLAPLGDAGCPPVVQPDAGCAYVSLGDGGSALPLQGDGGCFLPAENDGGCAEAQLADGGLGPFELEDAGCFVRPPPPPPPAMPCFQGVPSDAGLKLLTVGEVDVGLNTYPQAAVKVGSALWVPLYGGFGGDYAAGQKVVKVDVSNPALPMVTATVDLAMVDLKPFDGGTPVARPYAITQVGAELYVALNNLNAFSYAPEGPGLIAVINPSTLAVTTIDLGTGCLNPVALWSTGARVFVSCAGAAIYDPTFKLIGTSGAGVLAMNPGGSAKTMWAPQCPAGGDGGCLPVLPSRLAVRGGAVYLGDQNGGRIFVADISDGGFTERRGYAAGAAGGPIQACGVDLMVGFSNVADILVVP